MFVKFWIRVVCYYFVSTAFIAFAFWRLADGRVQDSSVLTLMYLFGLIGPFWLFGYATAAVVGYFSIRSRVKERVRNHGRSQNDRL